MKKFLLSLAMVFGLVAYASAGTVSFTMDQATLTDPTTDEYGNSTISGFSYDVITATLSKGSGNNEPSYNTSLKELRLYAGGICTISTTDGTSLENIVFTIPDGNGKGQTRLAAITADSGEVVLDNTAWTVTWSGSASEVTFTVGDKSDWGTETGKAGRLVVSQMEVTTAGEGIERSAAPVISPEDEYFGEDGVLVSIAAAEGAKIYYTLDGSNPTESSDLYTAPIALAATTTVKAIAVEEGKSASAVAEKTYTLRTGEFAMTDVITTASVGANLTVGGIVTGICTRGLIVTDNSGSILVYSGSFPYSDYKIGDQVTFSGEVTEYNKGLQFSADAITIEKWGNVAYTYPEPGSYDWTVASGRTQSAVAMYVEMEGALSISGNYYNVDLGLEGVQGSLYYATDEIKAKMANGQDLKLKGYFIGVSGSTTKYINLLVTEVVAEGEEKPATQVANIGEFIEKGLADETTIFEITGEVAVTYQNGSNLYISDATGQILVYGTLENTYNNGDRLTGVQGSFKNYYSTYELVAVSTSFGAATAGAAVEPEAYETLDYIVPEIQNHYVVVNNVTLDTENSKLVDVIDNELGYYNKFAIELPEAGTYNVVGVVNYYQAKGAEAAEVQLYPIEFLPAGETPALEAETLAEALEMGAAGETGEITITGNVSVVYKNNRNIYVKDDSAWTLIYNKTDVEMPAYKNGDVITGFKVTYATNDDHGQLLPVDGTFGAATEGAMVEPVSITTSGVADENYHKYVVLTADFTAADEKNGTATDSEGSAAVYAQWNNTYSDPVVALAADGKYDIKGFVGSYKGNYQILVTEFAEAGAVEGVELESPIAVCGNSIVAPEGAEIYTTSGVRVEGDNLAAGVYVVRVAGKALKIIVQ